VLALELADGRGDDVAARDVEGAWSPPRARSTNSRITAGQATLARFEIESPYAVVAVESTTDPRVRFVSRLDDGYEVPIRAPLLASFDSIDDVTLPVRRRKRP
jgi:hypothetical protein